MKDSSLEFDIIDSIWQYKDGFSSFSSNVENMEALAIVDFEPVIDF